MKSATSETRLKQCIPELESFGAAGTVVWDWLSSFGQLDDALVYGYLFWPQFEQQFGCVFLSSVDRALYDQWMITLNKDKSKVERMLNHRHLADVLFNSKPPLTTDKLRLLGELLKEAWTCKLGRDFPGMSFQVILNGDKSKSPRDMTITFFRLSEIKPTLGQKPVKRRRGQQLS